MLLSTSNMLLVAGNMLLKATCCRQQTTCYRQQNCCQFVVRLLLDTKAYMLPRYRQHVAGNMHVTGQHVAWCKRGLKKTAVLLQPSPDNTPQYWLPTNRQRSVSGCRYFLSPRTEPFDDEITVRLAKVISDFGTPRKRRCDDHGISVDTIVLSCLVHCYTRQWDVDMGVGSRTPIWTRT